MTKESETSTIIEFPVDRRDTSYYECPLPPNVTVFWFITMNEEFERGTFEGQPERIILSGLVERFERVLDPDAENYSRPGINGKEIEIMKKIGILKRARGATSLQYRLKMENRMQEVESSFNRSRKAYINSNRF